MRRWNLMLGLMVASLLAGCDSDEDGSGGTGGDAGSGGKTDEGGSGGTGGTGGTGGDAGSGGNGGNTGMDSGVMDSGTGGSGEPPTGCRAPEPAQDPGNACKGEGAPALQASLLLEGLDNPVFLTGVPGQPQRLLVVQRGGLIRVIEDGSLVNEPFLDVSGKIVTGNDESEQGLLGLALAPDYPSSGKLWINYTSSSGGATVVEAYRRMDGDPMKADPASASQLLEIEQPFPNHNGGMLAFGPDDCLYIGMGDGGWQRDPEGHGQNPQTMLASMLRVDPENYPEAAPGNLEGSNANPHVWDYGLRNPWRFSFDRETGDLYIGDVGQNTWEEVDVEPAGTGHRNYGWDVMEGAHCLDETGEPAPASEGSCLQPEFTLPVDEYRTEQAGRSVIGGYVYRGEAIPDMQGRYMYADLDGRVWTFTWNGDGICDKEELTSMLGINGNITSFGQDAEGELYILTLGGSVYRLDPG